jgi:hypothetical protein
MRDRRLQRVKAVVKRQKRMAPERYDQCLIFLAEYG